jgi:hypothetical protein
MGTRTSNSSIDEGVDGASDPSSRHFPRRAFLAGGAALAAGLSVAKATDAAAAVSSTAGSASTDPSITLGYAESTSFFSTASGGYVPVTGLTATVTADGVRPILVSVCIPVPSITVANGDIYLSIMEDGVSIVSTGLQSALANQYLAPINLSRQRKPAAGSHTYTVATAVSGGSAMFNNVGSIMGYLSVVQQ